MGRIIKNDKGQIITGKKELLNENFGTGEFWPNGEPVINWNFLEHADDDGFDVTNIEENGKYKMKIILPYGSMLIRYGSETGNFTAPKGTKYEELALPYIKDTVEYNEYRVIAKGIKVICVVEKGIVAPGFGSSGGAIQYLHPMSMLDSIKKNLLERICADGKI